MKLFLSMIGENYDVLKSYIDNYLNLFSREYGKTDIIPDNMLTYVGDNFGWEFLNTNQLKNLLQYFVVFVKFLLPQQNFLLLL